MVGSFRAAGTPGRHLELTEPVDLILNGYRELAYYGRILRWETHPGIPGWGLLAITVSLGQEGRGALEDTTPKALTMEEGAMNTRAQGMQLSKRKTARKWIRFSLELPERAKPCQQLDLSLVTLILDFWPPELKQNKRLLS